VLEARLGKLEGMQSAKVRGYDRESKFYFNLQISESRSIVPATIRGMLADLKKESKGEEDYPFNSFEFTAITGTVEHAGEAWTFTARGSGEKYDLTPGAGLKKLVEEGKSPLTISGKVSDEQGRLKIEVSDAKVPAN
jgi:hypothetical protein